MNIGSKILLLTDFSTLAGYAASYAHEIALKIKGEVEVMHIIQTPVDWIKLPKDREQFYPETKKEISLANTKLAELVEFFKLSGIAAIPTLIYSFGPENVFAHVQNSKADLVIMGSQGMDASRGFLLGSNALKVLRNVKIPTFIIKKSPPTSGIKKIGFLSSLGQDQLSVHSKLKNFAKLIGAQLDLVCINTPYNFFESRDLKFKFEAIDPGLPLENKILINSLNIERGIQYYNETYKPDLLVLAKSEKLDLVKFFSPSLTENLVREHDFPILSFPLG